MSGENSSSCFAKKDRAKGGRTANCQKKIDDEKTEEGRRRLKMRRRKIRR